MGRALRNRIIIQKKDRDERSGRGFSRNELREAGLSYKQALKLSLPVDLRRKSVHKENVKLIKNQLKKT